MSNFIEINNVSFKYKKGRTVFDNFSLTLNTEENTVLTGNNGSGKTTLSKLIMGILKPQRGEIKILGRDSSSLSLGQAGELIGYVYQYPERQLFAMSVIEELTFPLVIKGILPETALKEAEEMIEIFELDKVKDSYPFFLSYGEKRRLAIASVLMNKPKFLILDEPTASLDKERIESLNKLLDTLSAKKTGILTISHDEEFIERYGQRIIKIEGGKIISDTISGNRSSN
ncbi:ABC transporter ATP-binding protein [Sedimentibacter hydroxybenzoicus DSM 7310]|uniref:ABC transporter ATP-binding protein n=1 Tax=Sedimentibacter hydroxybenzoicus DSM 7310 TaxID=1123245 RepID=A0A974GWE8_SEDHY|nr:ABC transporter ATP-binding protein [Sedimentibacter hydroxybenzoicus]NYB74409.1 ABC transporter ATP-binding protein [Sedimentibacter hydroxybenzoicus DSM 7310]